MNAQELAKVAIREALKPFHGYVMTLRPNIHPIINLFPKWPLKKWNNNWCAAFVYYCCLQAGYGIPMKYPDKRVKHNFAGCSSWEQWAKLPYNQFYHRKDEKSFIPQKGDIVLYNRIFIPSAHDHIGILIEYHPEHIVVAEGNFNNISAVIERPINSHIRGYIRIPENYDWENHERESLGKFSDCR